MEVRGICVEMVITGLVDLDNFFGVLSLVECWDFVVRGRFCDTREKESWEGSWRGLET